MEFKIVPLSRNEFNSQIPTKEVLQAEMVNSTLDHDAVKKSQTDGWNYRMENYYNCVDDYSWGGPCDRAAADSVANAQLRVSLTKKQLESPTGTFFDTCTVSVLADLNGNPIEGAKVINTKFGKSWRIEDKNAGRFIWITSDTTPATYAKKGYMLLEREYKYEAFVIGDKKFVTLIESVLKPATLKEGNRKYYPSTFLDREVYFLLKLENIEGNIA